MTATLFHRARRVVAAGVEGAMSSVERASSGPLLRETVREAERAVRSLESDRLAVRVRCSQAEARKGAIAAEIARLGDQARFAVDQRRTDLAERTISRQVDMEAEAARIADAIAAADAEEGRLDAILMDMRQRLARMRDELSAFDGAREGASSERGRAARSMTTAEHAFARAMTAAGGYAATLDQRDIAEVAALKKQAEIAARLSALRADVPASKTAKRAGARS